ncbi:MAG: hypothetical protein HW373_1713, partial [Deltaproteobacteria bacterium]|nr:hypothetical protein [Deltaproteobacteria bacterium]
MNLPKDSKRYTDWNAYSMNALNP